MEEYRFSIAKMGSGLMTILMMWYVLSLELTDLTNAEQLIVVMIAGFGIFWGFSTLVYELEQIQYTWLSNRKEQKALLSK